MHKHLFHLAKIGVSIGSATLWINVKEMHSNQPNILVAEEKNLISRLFARPCCMQEPDLTSAAQQCTRSSSFRSPVTSTSVQNKNPDHRQFSVLSTGLCFKQASPDPLVVA